LAKRNIGQVIAVEPNINKLPGKLEKSNVSLQDLSEAMEVANIVVVLVDHKEFKEAEKTQLAKKVVIDTRGIIR